MQSFEVRVRTSEKTSLSTISEVVFGVRQAYCNMLHYLVLWCVQRYLAPNLAVVFLVSFLDHLRM